MSREDSTADVIPGGSFLSPLLSPATIVTPKWRRMSEDDRRDSKSNGPDGFALDSSTEVEEEEDISDDVVLRRHDEFAMEERKRWLPVDENSKSKSPSTKKRHKQRVPLPVFPTPYECNEIVRRTMAWDDRKSGSRPMANGGGSFSPAGNHSAGHSANRHISNGGSSSARNGTCNDQCLVITMESFKRLQDVLCREKDYFNRVLNGLEKCIRENEPSIAIHTDIDRKVVFSQDDFNHLIQSVKYSFESIDSIQLLLQEKSDNLKKEVNKMPKVDRSVTPRNGKSKHRSARHKPGRDLVPSDYKLDGKQR